MVKDYSHFKNRNVANFGNPVANEMLDWLQGKANLSVFSIFMLPTKHSKSH